MQRDWQTVRACGQDWDQAEGLWHSHIVQHIDPCLPEDICGVCKLRRAAMGPTAQDIADLACVSVFRASCQP